MIARYKYSSLLGLVISDEGKKFYNIYTRLDYDLVNKKQRANFYPTNVAPLWAECYSYVQLFLAKIARSFKVKKNKAMRGAYPKGLHSGSPSD